MADRRANSRSGHLYTSDLYDEIEAPLEKEFGLPAGGMRAIRTRGERSNSDQVSSAGARSVYQIIPETAAAIKAKYGFDPLKDERSAARGAAIVLRDGMRMNGNWKGAVRHYIGGSDPANHGPVTSAYVARVTGTPADQQVTPRQMRERYRATVGQPVRKEPLPSVQDLITAGLASRGGTITRQAPLTPDLRAENADIQAQVGAETERAQHGFFDRVMASVDKNWMLNAVIRGMGREQFPDDPNFRQTYINNIDTFEQFAQTTQERDMMRDAGSFDQLAEIQQTILANRERDKIINSNGTGGYFEFGSSLLDPVGWLATAGIGKAIQMGSKGITISKMAAEGGLTGLLFTGVQDYAGNDQTAGDYALGGAMGLSMGALLYPVVRGKGRVDVSDSPVIAAARQGEEAEAQAVLNEAIQLAGPNASQSQIAAAVGTVRSQKAKDWLDISLSDVGDDVKILTADENAMLTSDPVARARVQSGTGLENIDDVGERTVATEMHARAVRDDELNPINQEGLKGLLLKAAGQESIALTMLRSNSPMLRYVGRHLAENTTGAGGRGRTAAMSQVTRERLYMRPLLGYEDMLDQYRRQQGSNWLDGEFFSQRLRKEFDRKVYLEIERRQAGAGSFDPNPLVRKAADSLEEGYSMMRVEAQKVGTLGSQRLGSTSRGYQPRQIDARKIHTLAPEGSMARRKIEQVLARQFEADNEYTFIAREDGKDWVKGEKVTRNFDKKFANRLAKAYLTKAVRRGNGDYDVPMNIHTSEGADIISDMLEQMNDIPAMDKEAILGKFSRGGSGYTKGRLNLNLDEDLGNGLKLADLFNQDAIGLYRSYARRVSGEVALGQYGIYGTKGMKLVKEVAQRTGATGKELEALDQLTAELLNTPFGLAKRQPALDNLRMMTSAARLGGMLFPQLGEYANAVASVGVRGALSRIPSMPRLVREVGMLKKGQVSKNELLGSIDTLGGDIGLDDYYMSRMFDIKDNAVEMYNDQSVGIVGKMIRGGSHGVAVLSGHRTLVSVQTRGMAEQIVRKAIGYIKDGKESAALLDMGFTPKVQQTIRDNMDRIATFDSKGRLQKLDLMEAEGDLGDIMAFRDAVERGAGQIIQKTYAGERGPWAHNDFLKLLFQFRTFSLTSIEKQWGRQKAVGAVQGGIAGAVRPYAVLMGAMSFALPIHMARLNLQTVGMSRSEREKFVEERMNVAALTRATLNYASAAGLLGDFYDIGISTVAGSGLMDKETAKALTGAGQGRQSASGIVPGIGLADDLMKGTVGGDYARLLKTLPGNNLPYVTPLVHGITPDKD